MQVVEEIGATNIAPIVTDNITNLKAANLLIETKYLNTLIYIGFHVQ